MGADIKKMAKQGSDPKNIATLAKSVVRSGKAKGRLYQSRAAMTAASSELQNIAATMRLGDTMKNSAVVMAQMNSLINIPELHEAMQGMSREMMRAGLVDEIVEEGLEGIDGPDLEEEAVGEVDKILQELAIDAAVRMQVVAPAAAAAEAHAAAEAQAAAASGYPAAKAAAKASAS